MKQYVLNQEVEGMPAKQAYNRQELSYLPNVLECLPTLDDEAGEKCPYQLLHLT